MGESRYYVEATQGRLTWRRSRPGSGSEAARAGVDVEVDRGGNIVDVEDRRGGREGRPIGAFTEGSRRELVRAFTDTAWLEIPGRLSMVTGTMPKDWRRACPDGAVLRAQFKRFKESWARKWGQRPTGLWVREHQERGAPHLHLYVGVPATDTGRCEVCEWQEERARKRHSTRGCETPEFHEWALAAWYRSVGSGDPAHAQAGVNVRHAFFGQGAVAPSVVGAARYFAKESAKYSQKTAPLDWPDGGAWWGRMNLRPVVHRWEVPVEGWVATRRPGRALLARRVKGGAKGRRRSMDGLSVHFVDGVRVADRLLRWGEEAVGGKWWVSYEGGS